MQIFFSPSLDIWLHRVIVQSLLLPFKISHWKKVECLPMFTLHGRQIDSADREAPILELSQDSSSTEVEEGTNPRWGPDRQRKCPRAPKG